MELNFPQKEEALLKFWKENKVFEKSIKQCARVPAKRVRDFIFYEGPPTANAKPGIHHVLSRVFKDIICRYKTMQGFRVLRKAGWDTHGLPVELAIEKKLGLKNKKDIEKYGIADFNKECKASVWQYKQDWEKLTERIAFWLDIENPYITYENNYIETLWWIIKGVDKKGLLYKDYKIVPYCPRCGTSLSSHEVALGYKNVEETSIYVKFKVIKSKGVVKEGDYFLAWTTTPWTLPANVALAVNEKFDYVRIKIDNDFYILSKERLGVIGGNYEVKSTFTGSNLIGLEYEPIFDFSNPDKKAWFVIAGDFVSLEEGTGFVHIAPAFGEDDMKVGQQNNLPTILNVDDAGKFKEEVRDFAGLWVKDADPLIIKDLGERQILFKEEAYKHDYPFCWRCSSPLLYYAKESWFINMQKVKSQLIKNNQRINWVPWHLKEGRFGEWLKELKDWAFSRERYWGTPLPIWQCSKCSHKEVIGGKKDLIGQKFSTNNYYILRHGKNAYQVEKKEWTYPWPEEKPVLLNKEGIKQVEKAARELKKKNIDVIYFSDLGRTRQTAEIVNKELGAEIILDQRLRDVNLGAYHNGKKEKFFQDFPKTLDYFYGKKPPQGENWGEVRKRMFDCLNDIDKRHTGKNILIVSHGDPLWLLEETGKGLSDRELLRIKLTKKEIKTGEWRKLNFKNMPLDKEGRVDFHRPYIDEVKFYCPECGEVMARVPEVCDVWFDSGSMPFAQAHYPFEQKNFQFPADYISEAIDQTRGWFYTLLAVSTLLGFGSPYKNVISQGHVLDEKGEKMSKSKGNVVDPWYIIEKYGADAVRWYFYTVNQPGDPKLFAEKDIDQALKKFILILWNCFTFYQTYKVNSKIKIVNSKNILDKWVVSRLNELIQEVTENLDKYDVTGAARLLEDFVVNDLSLWYIRRSRKRFEEASATLALVFQTISKLTAPFVPFLSEEIYQKVKNQKTKVKSIHLEDWPKANKKLIDEKLNQKMARVREIVASALAERAKAGIKVRQPLASLLIPEKIDKGLSELIKDEVNVKKIIFSNTLILDTKITEELKEEGIAREVIRQINEMRKELSLTAKDRISIQYSTGGELRGILDKNRKNILAETRAKSFLPKEKPAGSFLAKKEISINQEKLCLFLKKENKFR